MSHRRLSFERLERRVLLAGDVKVELVGSDLIVTGDQSENFPVDDIAITCIADSSPYAYRITGHSGTRINGGDEPVEIAGVTRHIVVDLKSGVNEVSMEPASDGERFVTPGNVTARSLGQSAVIIRHADVKGKITVDGGNAFDGILLEDVRTADARTLDVKITTRGDLDMVQIFDSQLGGKLTVDTGLAGDIVEIKNTTVQKTALLKTGDGEDQVSVEGSTFVGKLTVQTGRGDDQLTIDPTAVELDLRLLTGDCADQVLLDNLTVHGNGLVDTGKGADKVGLKSVTANQNLTVRTGDDDDRLVAAGGTITGTALLDAGNATATRTETGSSWERTRSG